MQESATIVFEDGVSTVCERHDCSSDPTHAFVVKGERGKDGVVVYCPNCSQSHAERSPKHTYLGKVILA